MAFLADMADTEPLPGTALTPAEAGGRTASPGACVVPRRRLRGAGRVAASGSIRAPPAAWISASRCLKTQCLSGNPLTLPLSPAARGERERKEPLSGQLAGFRIGAQPTARSASASPRRGRLPFAPRGNNAGGAPPPPRIAVDGTSDARDRMDRYQAYAKSAYAKSRFEIPFRNPPDQESLP